MPIKEGDLVLVYLPDDSTYLVAAQPDKTLGTHKGNLNLGDLIDREYGDIIQLSRSPAYLLEPSIEDLIMKVQRGTNIVYPKEIGLLLLAANIRSGRKVLEIGTGSGALTIALAFAVAPEGRVYTYDVREDFLKLARRNVERAGVSDYVEFGLKKPGEPVAQDMMDAVILDIPAPWDEIETVKSALKPSGRLVSLNPTYNQIERMAETLRKDGFVMIRSMEILCRPILAREGRTRPVQQMVAHTEFILTAAYVGDTSAHRETER
ncbi:tRNA (adenine-N1)-methyltransferase [Candidatus Poribacteria bacterium]|nr:tRNA (adenine-N1)-methyltransferase [Candidatus Poribacteria bacterium]